MVPLLLVAQYCEIGLMKSIGFGDPARTKKSSFRISGTVLAVGTFVGQDETKAVVHPALKAAFVAVFFLHHATVFFSPFAASSHWAVCNILDLAGTNLKSWRVTTMMNNSSKELMMITVQEGEKQPAAAGENCSSDKIKAGRFKKILDDGFEILAMLDEVNRETGDLLLNEFMVNMASLVVVLLFHSSILVNFAGQIIEIDKERMESSKLTREIVYEKKAAKYEGVGRFAQKLRQFYELYLIASFLFFKSPQVIFFLQSS